MLLVEVGFFPSSSSSEVNMLLPEDDRLRLVVGFLPPLRREDLLVLFSLCSEEVAMLLGVDLLLFEADFSLASGLLRVERLPFEVDFFIPVVLLPAGFRLPFEVDFFIPVVLPTDCRLPLEVDFFIPPVLAEDEIFVKLGSSPSSAREMHLVAVGFLLVVPRDGGFAASMIGMVGGKLSISMVAFSAMKSSLKIKACRKGGL